ncbi:CDK-activating kinase assembly factor [Hypoxylon sp. NC1633]|nr:CDK-activating kinase assembly factor [Hypoxylon sp. NC1633]
MSRKPTASSIARPTAEPAKAIPTDWCPVCKRVRYLNKDMEFRYNPECYHPMCSNCVDNIFGKGPAQCPFATCGKTLRHRNFRSAFFGDLTVEREVDIRRRVQAVFNMTEDDFVTLRDYNDYLQQVEDLTFDLVNGDEPARHRAEQELLNYEQKHRDEIEKNKKRGREAETQRRQRDAADAEAARKRRLEELAEEQRARAEEATINAEVMEALARGESGSAAEIQARIVANKRARVAEIAGSTFSSVLNAANTSANTNSSLNLEGATGSSSDRGGLLSIRGLRDRNAADADADTGPYDAFAGLDMRPTRYELHQRYDNPWLEDARTRDDHRVPGYSTTEYVARALFEAFAGLGVVVGDEKAEALRAVGSAGARALVAASAGTATGGAGWEGDMDVDGDIDVDMNMNMDGGDVRGGSGGTGRMEVDDVFA